MATFYEMFGAVGLKAGESGRKTVQLLHTHTTKLLEEEVEIVCEALRHLSVESHPKVFVWGVFVTIFSPILSLFSTS